MGALYRLAALVTCAVALVLPFGARRFFAGFIATFAQPSRFSEGAFVRLQLAFWNKLILGTVFYVGVPVSKVLLALRGRDPLGLPDASPTFWEPRESARELARRTEDPF